MINKNETHVNENTINKLDGIYDILIQYYYDDSRILRQEMNAFRTLLSLFEKDKKLPFGESCI